jgi:seryl-tRNA synthetase
MEVQPPLLVNADSGYGTGQLPDKEGQMYHCGVDDLYLIPTAEVPITNLYRDVILNEAQLPSKMPVTHLVSVVKQVVMCSCSRFESFASVR